MPEPHFEVETRFGFQTQAAFQAELPFLAACLSQDSLWQTSFYGLELFRSGRLLRLSRVEAGGPPRFFLVHKGPDIGHEANIRQEMEEEATNGLEHSEILAMLGLESRAATAETLAALLTGNGYEEFMCMGGMDRKGYYEPAGLHVKLMHCTALRLPLLLEIEKTAGTVAEAFRAEAELRRFVEAHGLSDQCLKAEPPAFLYDAAGSR